MAEHWIDRVARAAAGTRRTPAPTPVTAPQDGAFTRGRALRSAAGFALTTSFVGFRPQIARGADGCTRKCEGRVANAADKALGLCINPSGGTDPLKLLLLPGLALFQNTACAALILPPAVLGIKSCELDAVTKDADGNCKFDGPAPPPAPRSLNQSYPPKPLVETGPTKKRPPKPPNKKGPKKPKKPPKKPGTCGNADLPPGAVCCGGVPCATGCGACGGCCCSPASGNC